MTNSKRKIAVAMYASGAGIGRIAAYLNCSVMAVAFALTRGSI
jgi:uncharacterized protein YjcR